MKDFIGVIGGSGLYNIGLERCEEVAVETPFGPPSDSILVGELGDVKFAFLPRHGKGHRLTPSEINYRANMFAMKKLGVRKILSVSAVGSMKESIPPGKLVLPDQFIDMTKKRESSFFGNGVVAHVSMAEPVCPAFRAVVLDAVKSLGYDVQDGGTYLCMEGPQFSTKAESLLWRSMNVDVIGMTNMPEAKLAREAEICYATLALSTDYDCWHHEEEAVSVETIIKILMENVEKAKNILRKLPAMPATAGTCECGSALAYAIITDRKTIPASARTTLEPLIGKYLTD